MQSTNPNQFDPYQAKKQALMNVQDVITAYQQKAQADPRCLDGDPFWNRFQEDIKNVLQRWHERCVDDDYISSDVSAYFRDLYQFAPQLILGRARSAFDQADGFAIVHFQDFWMTIRSQFRSFETSATF